MKIGKHSQKRSDRLQSRTRYKWFLPIREALIRMHLIDEKFQLKNMFRGSAVVNFIPTLCSTNARFRTTQYASPIQGWSDCKPAFEMVKMTANVQKLKILT